VLGDLVDEDMDALRAPGERGVEECGIGMQAGRAEALILGGGSLFAAAEVMKYDSLTQCTLVDHDPGVLEMMVKHYPHATKVMNDDRFNYVAADAVEFVLAAEPCYDVVVNDGLDLLATPALVNANPFSALNRILAPHGTCSDLIYRHVFDDQYLARTRSSTTVAGHSALSLVTVPEYPGILHLLVVWGGPHVSQRVRFPINRVQQGWRVGKRPPPLEFYDPRRLAFHLYLPPFVAHRWRSLDKLPTKT
jgi:spermidine synthase